MGGGMNVATPKEEKDEMVCRCGHKSGIHAASGQCKVCDCKVFMVKGTDEK